MAFLDEASASAANREVRDECEDGDGSSFSGAGNRWSSAGRCLCPFVRYFEADARWASRPLSRRAFMRTVGLSSCRFYLQHDPL